MTIRWLLEKVERKIRLTNDYFEIISISISISISILISSSLRKTWKIWNSQVVSDTYTRVWKYYAILAMRTYMSMFCRPDLVWNQLDICKCKSQPCSNKYDDIDASFPDIRWSLSKWIQNNESLRIMPDNPKLVTFVAVNGWSLLYIDLVFLKANLVSILLFKEIPG